MAILTIHHPLVFIFGILGNVISFLVYLVPSATFHGICKKKSTEGFHSVPYVVALFSSMLWLYYGLIKSNGVLLITINSFGCIIESIYIAIYIAYAPKKPKIFTLQLLVGLNVGLFSLICFPMQFLLKGSDRVEVLGWLSASISVSVFAAPLSIVTHVVRTKSVEFMPFNLSFTLTLSAVIWLTYGLLLKDYCVAVPNIVGVVLGILQMVLYGVYRNASNELASKRMEPPVVEVHPEDSQLKCKKGNDQEHLGEYDDLQPTENAV